MIAKHIPSQIGRRLKTNWSTPTRKYVALVAGISFPAKKLETASPSDVKPPGVFLAAYEVCKQNVLIRATSAALFMPRKQFCRFLAAPKKKKSETIVISDFSPSTKPMIQGEAWALFWRKGKGKKSIERLPQEGGHLFHVLHGGGEEGLLTHVGNPQHTGIAEGM